MQRKRLGILLSGSEGSLGRVCRAIDIFPTLATGVMLQLQPAIRKSASSFRASSPRISLLGATESKREEGGKTEERREKREEIDSLRGFTPGTLE